MRAAIIVDGVFKKNVLHYPCLKAEVYTNGKGKAEAIVLDGRQLLDMCEIRAMTARLRRSGVNV